jgi:hypothetical protein
MSEPKVVPKTRLALWQNVLTNTGLRLKQIVTRGIEHPNYDLKRSATISREGDSCAGIADRGRGHYAGGFP